MATIAAAFPASARPDAHRVRAVLAHTDWLRHDLVVTGPAAEIAALQAASCGAGGIPWGDPDPSLAEEDRVLALVRPPDGSRGLSLVAARVLARQLRDATEAHHQKILAAVGASRACPFDLHALVPIPAAVLQRGPDDPVSLDWRLTHWGTAQALRHVRLRKAGADKRLRRSARLAYEFWSADWTPWPVFGVMRRRWPHLVFDIRPDYGDA